MSELEPPKPQESTAESREVWTIALATFYRYATTVTGPTTQAGTVASYAQTIPTSNPPNFSQGIVILAPPIGQSNNFSNGFQTSSPYWVELTGDESPPLTEDEIRDIQRSWKEIKTGKSKKFDNARDAIEWLRSQRSKRAK